MALPRGDRHDEINGVQTEQPTVSGASGQVAQVLVEQITAVDPQRLGDFAGRLNPEELMEINVALRALLDLE